MYFMMFDASGLVPMSAVTPGDDIELTVPLTSNEVDARLLLVDVAQLRHRRTRTSPAPCARLVRLHVDLPRQARLAALAVEPLIDDDLGLADERDACAGALGEVGDGDRAGAIRSHGGARLEARREERERMLLDRQHPPGHVEEHVDEAHSTGTPLTT
jgi:hypothetical protein